MFLALTFDFWLALTVCILASLVWLVMGLFQHFGGSYYYKTDEFGRRTNEKVYDGKKIPLFQTPGFKMFIWHLIAGGFLFALIASDFWDVWFE